jgi:recombination protein RecA
MKTDATKEIEKLCGEGVLVRASDLEPIEYRSSGSIAVDVALGGGWAKRRIVQLQGKEGSGKTLLFDLAAIVAQRVENKKSLLFDFEGTYDVSRHIALGGDPNMMDLVTHESVTKYPMLFAEHSFDICKTILRISDDYACIGFDSTGAMVSVAEYEKKEEKGQESSTPFYTSRAMASGLPIITGMVQKCKSKPTIFFVSQGRDNIGAASFRGIPPPDKQTGGRALPFYATVRVDVSKGEVFKADVVDDATGRSDKSIEVGHKTRVRIRKNKANRFQGRIAEFDLYSEGEIRGIDRVGELTELSVYTRVIKQSGSWLTASYDETLRWHGTKEYKAYLSDPDAFEFVNAMTRQALAVMMDTSAEPVEDEDADTESTPGG